MTAVMDEVTLELDGSVYIDDLRKAIQSFGLLIERLGDVVEPKGLVSWEVISLDHGSAIVSLRGHAPDRRKVDHVVRAVTQIGHALEFNEPIPYPDPIPRHAEALTKILNGRVTAIRVQTAEEGATIETPYAHRFEQEAVPWQLRRQRETVSFGAVEGRVQTLSNRGGLRFTLYTSLDDSAVSCYVQPGNEDLLPDIWGKRASVEGTIHRSVRTGRTSAVRKISAIHILPETEPGQYLRARGVLAAYGLDEPAEVTIRRIRDAS